MQDGPFDSWTAFANSQFLSSIIAFVVGIPIFIGLFRNASQTGKLVENATSEDVAKANAKAKETAIKAGKEIDRAKATVAKEATESGARPSPTSTWSTQTPTMSRTNEQPTDSRAQYGTIGKRNRYDDAHKLYYEAVGELTKLANSETDGRYRRTYDRVLQDDDFPALAVVLCERDRISASKSENFIYLDTLWRSIGGTKAKPQMVDDSVYKIFEGWYNKFHFSD